MINNLAEGKPLKLLFFFVTPMVVENLFQQLYNMVDSMVVGRFVGEDVLTAVGSSFLVISLLVATTAGLSMGCTVVIPQFFGAGKIKEMRVTIPTALILLGVIGLVIMGIDELATGPLLKLLGTDPDIMADSLAYLRIYFGGAIFLLLYNSPNGTYNALGDSQTPLKSPMVSALTNIVPDLLFVTKFNMGVAGVAWTALIVQGFCAYISFFVFIGRLRKMESGPSARGAAFVYSDMDAARKIAGVGVPSMLQQFIAPVSMMMMQGLVNSYGKVFVVGYTTATRIDVLAMLSSMNFSNATSDYTAQNIGTGKTDRAKQGYKSCMSMVFILSLIITTLICLFGPQLLGLFLNQGAEGSAISYGLKYMKTVSVLYPLMDILLVDNSLLCGAGDMGAFVLSSTVNLSSRVIIVYLLTHYIGTSAIWWSIPTGWAFGFIFSLPWVKSGKWMSESLVEQSSAG